MDALLVVCRARCAPRRLPTRPHGPFHRTIS